MKVDTLGAILFVLGLAMATFALWSVDWRLGLVFLGLFVAETGRRNL